MKIFSLIFLVAMMVINTSCLEKEFELPDDATEKIEKLLIADPDDRGFIVFIGKSEDDYVQFANEKYGLLFDWPIISDNPKKDNNYASKIETLLLDLGYKKLNIKTIDREIIEKLKYKEYVVDFNGINAHVGTNSNEIKALTHKIFREIYLYTQSTEIRIDLELSGL